MSEHIKNTSYAVAGGLLVVLFQFWLEREPRPDVVAVASWLTVETDSIDSEKLIASLGTPLSNAGISSYYREASIYRIDIINNADVKSKNIEIVPKPNSTVVLSRSFGDQRENIDRGAIPFLKPQERKTIFVVQPDAFLSSTDSLDISILHEGRRINLTSNQIKSDATPFNLLPWLYDYPTVLELMIIFGVIFVFLFAFGLVVNSRIEWRSTMISTSDLSKRLDEMIFIMHRYPEKFGDQGLAKLVALTQSNSVPRPCGRNHAS